MAAHPESSLTSPPSHLPAPHCARILVVDDDFSVQEALRTALEPFYDIAAACTAQGARHRMEERPADLVLLDYRLPDDADFTTLRYIKRRWPWVPVIVLTAYGSEEVALAAWRTGARDYLRKPPEVGDLLARIQACLGVRGERFSQGLRGALCLPASAPAAPETGGPAAGLQHALELMRRDFHKVLTRDEVARAAAMSPARFSRAFKSLTGVTFRGYLTRLRLARAVELLRDPGRSIKEVALEVGFKHEVHFSRVFRKATGQPPSAHRRQLP